MSKKANAKNLKNYEPKARNVFYNTRFENFFNRFYQSKGKQSDGAEMSQNGAQLKLKNGTENGKSAPIRATKIDEIAMLN